MEFYYTMNRIYALNESGDTIAEITFPPVDRDTVNIDHTFVDNSLRGQGVAGKLVQAAAESLKRSGKRAVVTCSYARTWFEKHPEFTDILQK